jgi:hypothetical protein
MNKFGSLIVAALVAASAASVALGQGMGGSQSGMGMMKMDTNGDGVVSKDEYMKYHEAMFDHMKKNKEGMVSMKDMPEGCGMGSGGMMQGGKGSGQGMMGGQGMGGQGMMGGQGGGAKKTP